jgi:hypothetical protein
MRARPSHEDAAGGASQAFLRAARREYVAETPSGNAVEYTQWWLAHKLRKLIRMDWKEKSP